MEEKKLFLARKEWTATKISEKALQALLYEVSISPKAGLVTRHSNGSHRDMNFFHFLDSSLALRGYFEAAYEHRKHYPYGEESFFLKLRQLGKQAEEEMYLATKGVNTHKGTIFSMGIVLAVLGALWEERRDISLERLSKEIQKLCQPLLEELGKEIDYSKGEELYRKYRIRGARGLALSGYALVLEAMPQFMKACKKLDIETAAILQLFYYMGELEDTNIIARSDLKTLQEVQERSRFLYQKHSIAWSREEIREDMQELHSFCFEKNISPGGSADLLILTLFLYFLLEN